MARLGAAAQTTLEVLEKARERGQTVQRDTRSRAIENIGYNPMTRVMTIRFVDKRSYPTYQYPGVPIVEVAKFISSRSKGRHYHVHIRRQYGL